MAIITAMIEHSPELECFLKIREENPMEAEDIDEHETATIPPTDSISQPKSSKGPTHAPNHPIQMPAQPPSPEPQPGPSTQLPSWCKCGRCRQMPTALEQQCCRKTRGPCITITASTDLNAAVLNEVMLVVCIRDRNDVFVLNDNPAAHDTLRNMAYRRFILWKYGHLGVGNRRVIPSCVVRGIRTKYPAPNNIYVGYIPSRLN